MVDQDNVARAPIFAAFLSIKFCRAGRGPSRSAGELEQGFFYFASLQGRRDDDVQINLTSSPSRSISKIVSLPHKSFLRCREACRAAKARETKGD